MLLQVLHPKSSVPVSVEWTVPFRDTYFHVGVHNLSTRSALASMGEMERFTARPNSECLAEMLRAFDSDPGCLVVLNHPYWDETAIGSDLHELLLEEFVQRFRLWIHAFEINGLRDWSKSRRTVSLSRRQGLPLVSGGDRHGREPNAALNLTSAATFSEFAHEVRSRVSQVLLPQYRRPLALRIIETFADIVSDAPDHGLGWTLWTERVFRHCDDGRVRSLHSMCGAELPARVPRTEPSLCQAGSRMDDAGEQGAGISSALSPTHPAMASPGCLPAGHVSRSERRRAHCVAADRVRRKERPAADVHSSRKGVQALARRFD